MQTSKILASIAREICYIAVKPIPLHINQKTKNKRQMLEIEFSKVNGEQLMLQHLQVFIVFWLRCRGVGFTAIQI